MSVVVWFTGLPSSGKSTLARQVARALTPQPVLLDGDEVRAALRPTPGYDDAARADFYETLARLAALLAEQGHVVLVAATAHRQAYRALARQLAPAFVEIFVDTPIEECRRRDAKGLYARGTPGLPGSGAAYEAPSTPELVVRPAETDAVQRIVSVLAARRGGC